MCCYFGQHGQEVLSDGMTFEQRPEGTERVRLADTEKFGKVSPGRGRVCAKTLREE